jgi:hypothetical protein
MELEHDVPSLGLVVGLGGGTSTGSFLTVAGPFISSRANVVPARWSPRATRRGFQSRSHSNKGLCDQHRDQLRPTTPTRNHLTNAAAGQSRDEVCLTLRRTSFRIETRPGAVTGSRKLTPTALDRSRHRCTSSGIRGQRLRRQPRSHAVKASMTGSGSPSGAASQ